LKPTGDLNLTYNVPLNQVNHFLHSHKHDPISIVSNESAHYEEREARQRDYEKMVKVERFNEHINSIVHNRRMDETRMHKEKTKRAVSMSI
jgi:hypothetical protein